MVSLKDIKNINFDGNILQKITGATQGVLWTKEEEQDYILLEYIQSDGEQWIDTGLSNTGDYIIQGEFSLDMINSPKGDGSWVIGGRINASYALGVFMGSSGIFNAYGASTKMYSANFTINNWVELFFSRTKMYTINKNNGDKRDYVVSGQKLIPETYKTNVLIGKNQVNYTNTGDDPRNLYGKLKSFQIYNANNMELLRDYIPAIDKNTNRTGMKDLANNNFQFSAGGKDYIAGSLATTISQLNDLGIKGTGNFNNNQSTLNELGGQ